MGRIERRMDIYHGVNIVDPGLSCRVYGRKRKDISMSRKEQMSSVWDEMCLTLYL